MSVVDLTLRIDNSDDVTAEAVSTRNWKVYLTISSKTVGVETGLGDADDAEAIAKEIIRACDESRKILADRAGRLLGRADFPSVVR